MNAAPPAAAELGLRLVMVDGGGKMVNFAPADVPEGLPNASEIWGPQVASLRDRLAELECLEDQAAPLAAWLRIIGHNFARRIDDFAAFKPA